jgi:6 kDa early secretory antigenic target
VAGGKEGAVVSDVLVVNFAALQQASANIATALDSMRAQLDELEHRAAPLVSTWDGEAQQAFAQRQESWRRAAGDLSTTLRSIKLALDQSAAEYLHTERRNASLFR